MDSVKSNEKIVIRKVSFYIFTERVMNEKKVCIKTKAC